MSVILVPMDWYTGNDYIDVIITMILTAGVVALLVCGVVFLAAMGGYI